MSKRCLKTVELLPQWLAGSADHRRWEAHRAHIAWCGECAALVFNHVALWLQLEAWPAEAAPAHLDAGLLPPRVDASAESRAPGTDAAGERDG